MSNTYFHKISPELNDEKKIELKSKKIMSNFATNNLYNANLTNGGDNCYLNTQNRLIVNNPPGLSDFRNIPTLNFSNVEPSRTPQNNQILYTQDNYNRNAEFPNTINEMFLNPNQEHKQTIPDSSTQRTNNNLDVRNLNQLNSNQLAQES